MRARQKVGLGERAAARTRDSQFQGCHKSLTARLGSNKAIGATAHKLLRTVYAVLRDDKPYLDPTVDYECVFVKRNAARWVRMLKQHGFPPEMSERTDRVAD